MVLPQAAASFECWVSPGVAKLLWLWVGERVWRSLGAGRAQVALL